MYTVLCKWGSFKSGAVSAYGYFKTREEAEKSMERAEARSFSCGKHLIVKIPVEDEGEIEL